VKRITIYYDKEDTEFLHPLRKVFTIRGHHNTSGLHPNKDDEAEAIKFGKTVAMTVSFYEDD
jgi:hypothetical protein